MRYQEDLLVPAVIFIVAYLGCEIYRSLPRRRGAAVLFSNISLLPAQGFTKNLLLSALCRVLRFAAVLLLVAAFLRPQFGLKSQNISTEGVAIHMVLDRSSSMTHLMRFGNRDLTRLDAVKTVFKNFVLGDGENLKGRPNDLIAVSSFAFFTDENAPLTLDHRTLTGFVDQISFAERYEDGTMIGNALRQTVLNMVAAENSLAENPDRFNLKSKIIILLTDGVQTRGGITPLEAARFAKENGIKVYAIAISQDKKNLFGNALPGFLKFPSFGKKADHSTLKKVAEITGGKFASADSGESLQAFYQSIDQLEKTEFNETVVNWRDFFPDLIKWALALFVLEQIVSHLIRRRV